MRASNRVAARATRAGAGTTPAHEELLSRFAKLVRARYGARLYLLGSRSRGDARPNCDFDLVAVAEAFGDEPWLWRGRDGGKLWLGAGGWGVPMDFLCRTPEEFKQETTHGFGAVGWAKKQGELRRNAITKRKHSTVNN